VDVQFRTVWGVEVPSWGEPPAIVRSLALRDQAPTTPGPAAEATATAFERLIERLVEAAPRELLIERLSEQLARTTRQVNQLEQRLAPALQAQIGTVRRVLEEREREDHQRLLHLLGTRERG
jgi:V/A-type H+-transporting ATPase subunit D